MLQTQQLMLLLSGFLSCKAAIAEELVTEVDLFAYAPVIKTGTRLQQHLRLAKKLRVGQWQGLLEFLIHNIGADCDQDNVFERRLFVRLQFDLE